MLELERKNNYLDEISLNKIKEEVINFLLEKELLPPADLISNEKKLLLIKKLINKKILITESLLNKSVEELESLLNKFSFKKDVILLKNYLKKPWKITFNDFVNHWRVRYKKLSSLLKNRYQLDGLTSISRIKSINEGSLIGFIKEKNITNNKNIILTLEDPTGEIKVIITNKNKELFNIANDLVLDQIIGIKGKINNNFFFPELIIEPDIPITNSIKYSPEEEYMLIIGDPHVGSKSFLEKEFNNFLDWLNQKIGSDEQKKIASKVRYIFFTGDVVEGVGVYPNQDKDLSILSLKDQYDAFTNLIKKIPPNINIIIAPGNHDAGRIAEPQPPLDKNYASSLYEMHNVTLVSSPSVIQFGMKKNFSGFKALIYHGYSLVYYADNIPSIRNNGGQKATHLILRHLLKKRHLAPTHGSNLYIPDPEDDFMVIDEIPDFFLTGHIHRIAIDNYRGVTMINASTWSDITEDQEKRGLEPQPARVPIVNLKTREIKILNFFRNKK